MTNISYRENLRQLCEQAGYPSLPKLAEAAEISSWYLSRLEWGLIAQIPLGIMVKLAIALGMTLEELWQQLGGTMPLPEAQTNQPSESEDELLSLQQTIEALETEYARLQEQLNSQSQQLESQWQQQALEILEPWLLQWPTAAAAAQQNSQWPAQKLLPLTKPIATLLQQWQVEAIAAVGEMVPYDPQCHEFIGPGPGPEIGTMVVVRYVGYRRNDALLYRAKVGYAGDG
ncbi:helix-turn-helix domain-containing protein [Synechocystis salina LEGE 06099]|uniref:helix-turn-helix domain-containing protein n=1 Tax=Synechocystis salina TaxID=945780 RepID=UPI001881733C|nr:helix-turn-helix domain-containing protein [Synechocystis salina]MBE9204742.1 helix-turn-helix domain-containing protein [Synechocystis salina LEGE 06099]